MELSGIVFHWAAHLFACSVKCQEMIFVVQINAMEDLHSCLDGIFYVFKIWTPYILLSESQMYTNDPWHVHTHPMKASFEQEDAVSIFWIQKKKTCPPLTDSSNEMFLRCVCSDLHQAAAAATGVHPEGPFKAKDMLTLTVKALKGTGPSWATTLEAHTGALWNKRQVGIHRWYAEAHYNLPSCTFHSHKELWPAASCGDAVNPPGNTLRTCNK